MLFNSPEFIFVFLPAAVVLHFLLARHSVAAACLTTTITSLIFYLWWRPPFVLLPVLSILVNFALGSWIVRADALTARRLMILGICGNMAVLIYFKYADFLLSIVTGMPVGAPKVPLALSFTTFVQIAFLVDVWRRREVGRFDQYSMFVAFFPHLIAGPIVRWTELGPQIAEPSRYRVDWNNVALGLTIFLFGLAKKMLIADPLGEFVAPVFDAAARGEAVTAAAAWGGALAYSGQLYFDFSGYSEMAIGLGLLFNLRLPINFAAPFRATSIVDFWRRWHVSLSRFLRDFVYVPLGGSRRGPSRSAVNLVATVTIGGLWHGAGWTFIAWGAWNGVLLAINHRLAAVARIGAADPHQDALVLARDVRCVRHRHGILPRRRHAVGHPAPEEHGGHRHRSASHRDNPALGYLGHSARLPLRRIHPPGVRQHLVGGRHRLDPWRAGDRLAVARNHRMDGLPGRRAAQRVAPPGR